MDLIIEESKVKEGEKQAVVYGLLSSDRNVVGVYRRK